MEILFEIILEIFGEILFSITSEAIGHFLLWLGFGSDQTIEQKRNSTTPLKGFVVGILSGLLSLLVISHPIIQNFEFQLLNLFLTPLYIGIWTLTLGEVDKNFGKNPSQQDTFLYGATFGFAFALTRLIYFIIFRA